MIIEKIYIEGFGSVIDEIKYNFSRPGLTIIRGKNGVGKTTIFSALSWVLFRQVLKKGSSIEPWPTLIKENPHFKGTKVTLKLVAENGDKYTIIRCKDYRGKVGDKSGGNRLIILKNNKELFEGVRDKGDHQKYISQTILNNYSYDLFKNTVLFGQELKRLMQEDGPSKKKVFEEAFETTFILRAKELAEKDLVKEEKVLSELEAKEANITMEIGFIRQEKETVKESRKRLKTEYQYTLKETQAERDKLTDNIRVAESQLKKVKSEADVEISVMQELIKKKEKKLEKENPKEFEKMLEANQAESHYDSLVTKLNQLKSEFENVKTRCPECGNKLPKEKIVELKEKIKEKIHGIKKQIPIALEGYKAKKAEHADSIIKAREYTKRKETIVDLKYKLGLKQSEVKHSIEVFQNIIKASTQKAKELDIKIHKYHELLKSELPPLKPILKKLKNKKAEKISVLKNWSLCKKSVDNLRWLINDPLSNTGLKAYIFDSMLAKVNNNLKLYSQYIGFTINVNIDLEGARKDIFISIIKSGIEVPYEDLSKGQKQLVDVSIAFSLNDTVSQLKPINILLMDEVFESLSVENIEIVGNIIHKKALNKSVHLITHQNSFNPTNSYRYTLEQDEAGKTLLNSKFKED